MIQLFFQSFGLWMCYKYLSLKYRPHLSFRSPIINYSRWIAKNQKNQEKRNSLIVLGLTFLPMNRT